MALFTCAQEKWGAVEDRGDVIDVGAGRDKTTYLVVVARIDSSSYLVDIWRLFSPLFFVWLGHCYRADPKANRFLNELPLGAIATALPIPNPRPTATNPADREERSPEISTMKANDYTRPEVSCNSTPPPAGVVVVSEEVDDNGGREGSGGPNRTRRRVRLPWSER